MKFNLTFY